MIAATSGTTSASRPAEWPTAPDPGNRIGVDVGLPGPSDVPVRSLLSALNPLQHLPVVGMIYRAATGDDIPPALKIAGSALFGGPIGVFGTVLGCFLEEMIRLGPDRTRPAAPAGFSVTGQEAGPQPVTPGTAASDAYLTLATAQPAFLGSPTMLADMGSGGGQEAGPPTAPDAAMQQRGAQAYKVAETEWQHMQWLEKGIAA